MAGRLLLVIALLAGCDKLFQLDDVRSPTDASSDVQRPDDDAVVIGDAMPLDPRVIARFDFESTFVDARSGIAATCLTGSGCPSYKAAVHGKGIDLDGIDDCLKFTLPNNPTQLTVAFWLKKPTDVGAAFVSKPFAATNSNSWQIDAEPNRSLRFITYDGANNKILIQDAGFALGVWQHIAVTFDGSKKIFVNGIVAPNSTIAETMVSDGSALLIGCDHDTATYVRFFAGMLDEVIVYNVALTPAEIAVLAQP